MTQSASDKVLTWCRGNGRANGAVPCMRTADGRCNLWDNSYIEPHMLFSGESWEQVWDEYCAPRDVVPPTIRDTTLGAPSLAYMQRGRRSYRRGARR